MSNNNSNSMGILKLERKNNNTFCNIKTYNENLFGNYILGMKVNNKIIKQNISLENNTYSFISSEINNLDDLQGCVLIKLESGEFSPILWGNNKDKNYKANIINSLRQSINNISNSKIKETINQNPINNTNSNISKENKNTNAHISNQRITEELENKKNIEQLDTNTHQQNNTTLPEQLSLNLEDDTNFNQDSYNIRKLSKLTSQQKLFKNDYAYHPIKNSQNKQVESLSKISLEEEILVNNNIPEIAISCNASSLFESDENEIQNIIDNELKNEYKPEHEFYNMIKDQLDELFDRYPPEENLIKLVDNSYWVKINTDIDNKYYVVGIIKNNNDIKYICYGVPGNYNIEPPSEMKEYSQWLPTNITDPYNNGYWVMYQDADTGENIFIN